MKKVKLLTLSGFILGVVFVSKTTTLDAIYSDVELKNIEALANNEMNSGEKFECYDIGSVECVDGGYSEFSLIYKFDRVILPN